MVDTAQLIPLARELCLNGQFSAAGTAERKVYTITLNREDASDIVSKLLPELDRLDLSFSNSRLRITLVGGELDSLALDCAGSLRVVSRDIDTSVLVTVSFNDNAVEAIPGVVQKVLVK